MFFCSQFFQLWKYSGPERQDGFVWLSLKLFFLNLLTLSQQLDEAFVLCLDSSYITLVMLSLYHFDNFTHPLILQIYSFATYICFFSRNISFKTQHQIQQSWIIRYFKEENSMPWLSLSVDVFRKVVRLNLYCRVIL